MRLSTVRLFSWDWVPWDFSHEPEYRETFCENQVSCDLYVLIDIRTIRWMEVFWAAVVSFHRDSVVIWYKFFWQISKDDQNGRNTEINNIKIINIIQNIIYIALRTCFVVIAIDFLLRRCHISLVMVVCRWHREKLDSHFGCWLHPFQVESSPYFQCCHEFTHVIML